jgi:hypothetical protein
LYLFSHYDDNGVTGFQFEKAANRVVSAIASRKTLAAWAFFLFAFGTGDLSWVRAVAPFNL